MKTILLKSNRALQNVKNISLLIIALGFTFFSNAQTWGTQSSFITDDINGLTFSKSINTGFAVASGGRILKTTNSGINWVLQNSGTVNNLHAVSFSNNVIDTGYIVGDSGTVLMTTNGGSNWSSLSSGTSEQLNDIDIKGGEGFIVGDNGVILHVSGTTITALNSGTTSNLYGVHMLSNTTVAVVGGGILTATLLVTYNTGTVWTPISTGAISQLNDVKFVNDSTAYVVGNAATILKTTDWGINWTTQTAGSISNLNAVCFVSADSGYIAGATGTLLRTTNGGATWTASTSATTSSLNDIAFTDQYKGYAAGSGGTIIRTCPTASFNPSPNDSICVHSAMNFMNGSKNSTSQVWLKEGDTVSTNMDYTYTFDSAGAYTITLIADNGTCQNSTSKVIRVAEAPEVDLGPDTSICSNCTVTLDAGNPGSAYKWYREGVATGVISRTNTVGLTGTYSVEVTNTYGCVSTDTVKVSFATGLKGFAGNITDVAIYPNPNHKLFAIDFTIQQKGQTTVTVTNIVGGVVYTQNLADFSGKYTGTVSLEAFSTGVYFVKIQSGENTQTTKVITY